MKIPRELLHSAEGKLMSAVGAACERGSWRQCRYAGMWLGLLFHHSLPARREISIANLRLAFPHLNRPQANRIARRVSQNAAMTFCEFLHMRAASERELREYSQLEGYEHVEAGFAGGKGVIILTGHLGNWEIMGARAALEFPVTVIARPRSNPAVHQHIEAIRASAGVRAISRFDAGREPLKVLRRNEALGILPDQYEKEGPLLPFFNQPTRVVDALARLALLSGATVVPSFGVRQSPWLSNGRITAQSSPGFTLQKTNDRDSDVLQGTQRVIAELEKVMTAHPDQWLWMHRRWRAEDGASFQPAAES